MQKAQTSIEFIAAIGFLLLVFIVLVSFITQIKIDLFKTEIIVKERTECIKLANLITETYLHEDGIIVNKDLEFNASIEPSSRLISIKNKEEVFCTIPISSVTKVDLLKGNLIIKNNKGIVVLENV